VSFFFHLGLAQRTARTQAEDFALGLQRAVSVAATAYVLLQFVPLSLALRYFVDAPADWVFLTGAVAITYACGSRNARDFNGRAQCSDCLCSAGLDRHRICVLNDWGAILPNKTLALAYSDGVISITTSDRIISITTASMKLGGYGKQRQSGWEEDSD